MAKMQFPLPHVGLRLQQPNSKIELGGHVNLLIPGQVQNIGVHCVAVMTSDKRDVAVASVTKFGTAIANGSALLCQGRRPDKGGEQGHKEGRKRMHRSSVGRERVGLHGLHPDLNGPIQTNCCRSVAASTLMRRR